ncbi:flagellar hook-associated protein FlgK [Geobacter argillaceus]|uniref:Flagellar hook-associated protein 1 n=1 Tax=Geobacter argillaceus TaxID=345631 RepID=A0A562VJG1_9BACT|nr:flagellar hook-associated protein FlgK [Geobacter argillaceus]TWJ18059.1 flagellar hook-associated protein 1 FlgK [Geobacter argillaceus]
MGVNDIFNVGVTGVTASRLAIEVTSENMANVNTAGYSRQITQFETGPTITSRGFALGTGVNVASVQRSYDALLQRQIVDANSSQQQALARQKAMSQVEPLFNELAANGLGDAVQKYFGAWQDLSVNPSGGPERQALLARSQILVDTFHQTNASLKTAQKFADDSLGSITSDITDKAKNIASLNTQILMTERLGTNANELRDQRDQLVTLLAQKTGITYQENPDGTLKIQLPDPAGAGGGEVLVNGGQYATVYADNVVGPKAPLNDIYITAIGNPPPATNPAADTRVTATIGGPNDATKPADNSLGQIGGVLKVRDQIIPGLLNSVDELAYNLSNQVNTQHAAGFGLNSATGNNFFTPAAAGPLPAAPAAFANYSANIDINNTLKTNLDAIAAANVDPAVGGRANNTIALNIAGLQSASVSFNSGSSTLGGYYSTLVSNVGILKQDATNASTNGGSFLRQLNNLRESNSGVSLDEELTNLIKYQKSFEGSSRLISTATQMMDTILGLVR